MTWRYIAQRLSGDGAGEFIDFELPLRDVALTDVLSGPPQLSATLSPEVMRLVDAGGERALQEWSTAIYAEADGQIRLGTILANSSFNGALWELDCVGFCGYAGGMPYTESIFFVEVDPLDVVRHIWDHLQAQPGGDIGLVLDDTTTPIRIGTELEQVEFDTEEGPVSFEAGPVKLAWYQTDDLGREIDSFAEETPFDYHEEHEWSGDEIIHRLRFGYPRMGRRRSDLRFVLGENVAVIPTVTIEGDSYANQVLGLGAGEGRDMKRGHVSVNDGRLRRVAVVEDKSLRSIAKVTDFARRQLAVKQGLSDITEIAVRDHPHAPVGSWTVGDEIRLMGDAGWADIDMWVRILSSTINPETGNAASLSVMRADKVGTT